MNSTYLQFCGAFLLLFLWAVPCESPAQTSTSSHSSEKTTKDAPYVPTPNHIVYRMLEFGEVESDDVVYDLGSGDGRFIITAAKEFGARGVGIEIDPELVKQARRNARRAGVADKVKFYRADLFDVDISEATVVMLYLWPNMMNRLKSKLQGELSAGTRIVSHDFDIEGWPADSTASFGSNNLQQSETRIHKWTLTK